MAARKKINQSVRQQVYEKYNGHCAYCGCRIDYKDMQVDHLHSVWNSTLDGKSTDETIDNYMPSCRMCNFYKGGGSLDTFRNRIVSEMMPNLKQNFGYRLALKYGLISENEKPITFYHELVDGNSTSLGTE